MTYTVYGLRLRGEREARYIGFTRVSLDVRLARHIAATIDRNSNRPVVPWLKENRDRVEAFAIAKCETGPEARATESVVIALCLRLNQRLLNTAQVPPHLHVVAA